MSRSFVVKWSKCNLYNHLRNNAVQGLYGHNKQWYSYYFSQMLYQSIDVKTTSKRNSPGSTFSLSSPHRKSNNFQIF